MSAIPTQATAIPASAPMFRGSARLSVGIVAGQDHGMASQGASFLGNLTAALGPASDPGAAVAPADGVKLSTVGAADAPASSDRAAQAQVLSQGLAGVKAPLPGTMEVLPQQDGEAVSAQQSSPGMPRVGRLGMGKSDEAPDDRALADAGMAVATVPEPMVVQAPEAAPLGPPAPQAQAAVSGDLGARGVGRAAPSVGRAPEAGRSKVQPSKLDAASLTQDAPLSTSATSERPLPKLDVPGLPAEVLPDPAKVAAGLAYSVAPPPISLAAPGSGPVGGPALAGPAAALANGEAPARAASSVYPQVVPAVVSLVGGPPGTHQLTLRLNPLELGHVQIQIIRARDAPPDVSITAERPETLALLQRDQHQLHLALDQAGIQAEGRQVTFHSVAPSSDGPGAFPSGQSPSGQLSGSDPGGSGRDRAGQQGARGGPHSGHTDGNAPTETNYASTGSGWLRAGLDITA